MKNNENDNNKNKKISNKIIKVKIIFKNPNESLEQKIKSDISKNNENEDTEIEIGIPETIENLIKKYCNIKQIKKSNLCLMTKDLKNINSNLTINQANIENNETIFIYEENENKIDSKINEEK